MTIAETIDLVKDMVTVEKDLTDTQKTAFISILVLIEKVNTEVVCPECKRVIER